MSADAAQSFITRWRGVTASELSTAQSFVIDLCVLLGVDKPHPTPDQSYMFERPVTFRHGDGSTSAGRIDCYRQGAFCLSPTRAVTAFAWTTWPKRRCASDCAKSGSTRTA
jgi:hypothetical protein